MLEGRKSIKKKNHTIKLQSIMCTNCVDEICFPVCSARNVFSLDGFLQHSYCQFSQLSKQNNERIVYILVNFNNGQRDNISKQSSLYRISTQITVQICELLIRLQHDCLGKLLFKFVEDKLE